MNKKRVWYIISAILLTGIVAVFFIAMSPVYTTDRINKEVMDIKAKLDSDTTLTDEEAADLWIDVFDKISMGRIDQKEEMAQLLRDVTNNRIPFKDEDVFDVAKSYSDMFKLIKNGFDAWGISDIRINADVLQIDYADIRSYSVKMLGDDEEIYTGDYSVNYSGELGKNVVVVTLYDTEASSVLRTKYVFNQVYNVGNYKIKWVENADHAVLIYIGSDQQISIKSVEQMIPSVPIGTININLK